MQQKVLEVKSLGSQWEPQLVPLPPTFPVAAAVLGLTPALPCAGNCSRLLVWTGSTCSEPASVPGAGHPNQGHQTPAGQRGHRGWHFNQIRNAFLSCSVPHQQLSASPCSSGELLLHPASQAWVPGSGWSHPKAPKLH